MYTDVCRLPAAAVLMMSFLVCGDVQAQGKDEAEEDEARQKRIMERVITHGEVCPDPDRPCLDFERFERNELSFKIHREFKFDRGQDRSAPFYAVILRSAELCRIPDE